MRRRLSVLGLSLVGLIGLMLAAAPPARAQSAILGTWSIDRECSARALRVTFGDGTLIIERNGRRIYRGGVTVVADDAAITVRLLRGSAGAGDSERNVIRFGRDAGAIRMLAGPDDDGTVRYARVPPLYPCQPASADAAPTVQTTARPR